MKNKYIKSPLQYTGGKYKLLSQIIPLFPNNINTFVDLFGGGFNVGINVNAKNIVYNDACFPLVELLKTLQSRHTEALLKDIDNCTKDYQLSKDNKEGYLKLREDYKYNNNPIFLYTLMCHSFNNQIRFNKQGDFNMPFGERYFNPILRQRFVDFVDVLHNKDCIFLNKSFNELDFEPFDSKDLIYCDPPYLGSVATYNESKGWTEEHERELLELLDELNANGVRFALSNNLKYNNPLLDSWKEKYNVHYLECDYNHCNYQKKDKSKDLEILITNY